ncbi:MAG: hypothetical protein PHT37_00425 [Candidatus Cloacimonetes bacterium]|jgi:shikimate 5-dehydrogenase/3-dehydroquinate dehydratase|nr:hypothetical protein [Candidatus Cloacimonadota bacterium]MDD4276341.1 hypothetical protein [Candidatus Cloacimonadota bacterium]MDY0324616.1 hypothetical protein [Candidatus Cloacimonadaceae bacterium]
MIVVCIPYRAPENIAKESKGSIYHEYRLDFCEDWQSIDFTAFPKKSILTFRGSNFTLAMLQDMLSSRAMIDLDIRQLEEFPDLVEPERLVLSTHLEEYDEDKIRAFLDHPQRAKVYKLILKAKSFAEILATSHLIHDHKPQKMIFNVIGKWALFQRGLYDFFSSEGVYAALDEPSSEGQPDLKRLRPIWKAYTIDDYRCIAIVGDEQVNNSGSILLGNEYLMNHKLNYVYLPVPAEDLAEALDVIKYLYKNLDLAGIAITSPYKKAMAEYLRSNQPIINTAQFLHHKHLHNSYHPELDMYVYATNTDLAALKLNMQILEIQQTDKILIYGSGNCAEVFIQHLLRHSYRDISLLARNQDKANDLIQQYQIKAASDQEYDLLINATPLGKKEDDDISRLPKFKKVIDLVLKLDTPALLIQKAEAENLPHAQGFEFWVRQFYPQFQCIRYEDEENY